MRRLTLCHSIEWLLRQKRRLKDFMAKPAETPSPVANPVPVADPPMVSEPVAVDTHPLAQAPIGSKIVVVREDGTNTAMLAGPDGVAALPAGDPAHELVAGAKIAKHSAGYRAECLMRPDLAAREYPSASQAIAAFNTVFG